MKYILIFLIAILLTSCEGVVEGNGVIISSADKKPIDSVCVFWTNGHMKSYTDSLGKFEIGSFCGCVPDCPDLELLFYKKGYETKYVNFSKENYGYKDTEIILLTPTNEISRTIVKTTFEQFLKYFNLIFVSLFNVFTLIVVCRTKFSLLANKVLWTILILFFSTTLKYNYYSGEIDLSLFSFFVQLTVMKIYYIGWYLYFLPTPALIFWTYHFYKKKTGKKLLADA